MKTFKNFLAEAKQVGILYHYTSLENMLKIIKTNEFIFGRPENGETRGSVCFTRDKNFHRIIRDISDTGCRFVIDGNRLSNHYKVEPYNWYGKVLSNRYVGHLEKYDEQEERVVGKDIKQVADYVISLDVFEDGIRPEFLDKYRLNDDQDLISHIQAMVPYEVNYIE